VVGAPCRVLTTRQGSHRTDVDVVDRNLPVTIDETPVLEPITF
jgi:hypothetical protein